MLRRSLLYLLDTCVCIDLLRRETPLGSRLPRAECWLSSVVAAELWTGVHKHPAKAIKRVELMTLLEALPVLAFDSDAEHYGDIRADLERKGTPIGPNDLLIAAHARSLDATVVTANVGEFRRVTGLNVQAW